MPNIGPNHKWNQFFLPVPKSPNHTGLICVKKIRNRLGHAWAPLRCFWQMLPKNHQFYRWVICTLQFPSTLAFFLLDWLKIFIWGLATSCGQRLSMLVKKRRGLSPHYTRWNSRHCFRFYWSWSALQELRVPSNQECSLEGFYSAFSSHKD